MHECEYWVNPGNVWMWILSESWGNMDVNNDWILEIHEYEYWVKPGNIWMWILNESGNVWMWIMSESWKCINVNIECTWKCMNVNNEWILEMYECEYWVNPGNVWMFMNGYYDCLGKNMHEWSWVYKLPLQKP